MPGDTPPDSLELLLEKTVHKSEFSARATLLAEVEFFPQRFISEKIIFAEMPAGEDVVYGVAVHLKYHNFYCTCPFYPKPCTHALALKTLFDRKGETIFTPVNEIPEWAGALSGGVPAVALAKTSASATADRTKRQRRFERLERTANGFDDLEAWLLDTTRRGLATVVSEDPKWYEGIAARMADASMSGLSRALRMLGQIPSAEPDWAEQAAGVVADCYLAIRAFRKRDTLPESLLCDLQNFIGINTKKEEVLASGERVQDIWAIAGQIEEPVEDKLLARRTWLIGGKTRQYALILDYAFGGAGFPPGFKPGGIQQGTLAFYSSAFPQRALVVDDFISIPKKMEKLPGFPDLETFAEAYSTALALQPWLQIFPAAFSEVTPYFRNGKFFLIDPDKKSLPLKIGEIAGWQLLALSGGFPIGVFGEWDGMELKPLSAVAEERFVVL
ncbi:MAG: hypothetical protein DYG98_12615 [Haliscomenobacteraceae bacterium CHB4]|nr:hypothetical protein [Saprospiraceae bacterium]MCE7923894.1 hypothetical protein [Haliscomenobacteraceae bacterium CHB4]